ncbi:RNA polymerase subunit Rpo13 [Sulfuracidifex metallicus]|uniref:RNA polymerase subunit Rpo13 n=1 Tax=Sulfuracidifex metallicus TaxID=47303 RepID=UPI0006D14F74|nr:RNA polymerase subunit Rpo13 [Sulfuracidifex metallicus]
MHEDDETEHEIEREDDDLPFLSIQDIEILMRNTEIWDKLLQGKINIDEARREFEVNGRVFDGIEDRKKAKKQASRKKATRKRATKRPRMRKARRKLKKSNLRKTMR